MNKRRLNVVVLYSLMVLLSLAMIFPFIWTFLASVKSESENISPIFKMLPDGNFFEWQWSNYTAAMEQMFFWRSLSNTMIVLIPKLFGDVIMSAITAYGFARFEFPYKKQIFLVLLASLIVPFEITMIPMYFLYSQLGWIDTYLPLVVPVMFGGASGFIFFLTMYFITMPQDLVAAARVDGLNDLEIFFKIYLPISLPAMIVVCIWSFQGTWNDLLGPLIWLQSSEKFTLQLSLASLSNTTTYHVDQGVMMAGTILVMIPILLLFIALQRYILDSSKSSGIKG